MAEPDNYTTIRVHQDDRDKARKVKEAREQTWREFLNDAADELGPDIDD